MAPLNKSLAGSRVSTYPFIPRSTTHLVPGQFWALPLSNNRFAAGCVLAKLMLDGKIHTRLFLAGLLDWSATVPPRIELLTDVGVLERGAAHIKAIVQSGSILGVAQIGQLPHSPLVKTDDIHTWGYSVISVLAEKYFGKAS